MPLRSPILQTCYKASVWTDKDPERRTAVHVIEELEQTLPLGDHKEVHYRYTVTDEGIMTDYNFIMHRHYVMCVELHNRLLKSGDRKLTIIQKRLPE